MAAEGVAGKIFLPLLLNLRAQGVGVGLNEWLAFLDGLSAGLARNITDVYRFGRSVLVHTEEHYDAFDLAFNATFAGVELKPELKLGLEAWLSDPAAFDAARQAGLHDFESLDELMEAFLKTLREQEGRHEGGNRWVGTGGTSPYGSQGRANQGLQLGEGQGGGGRSGVQMAQDRAWVNYRTDVALDVRDFKVALRALRKLAREGSEVLDLDQTIDATARNAGDVDLVFDKERANRVRLVLLMDAGGSMAPHYRTVSRLFTAAQELKTFKTFEHYYFHNCVYRWLYRDYQTLDRRPTDEVLRELTPQHRLIFVGDASMAPWELFSNAMGFGDSSPSGIDNLARFRSRCPSSIWLNPDPKRYWDHPTVRAIGNTFPMFPLSVDGLRRAVKELRRTH